MNKLMRLGLFFLASIACLHLFSSGCLAVGDVELRKGLNAAESRCLHKLFRDRPFTYASSEEIAHFVAEAAVGRADLRGDGHREFIFLVHDIGYCGTAGCMMLIGEQRRDRRCHLIAELSGDGNAITVLDRRDHGHRRLYTPCEFYFDGRQYHQVREECPNANVHR